jgi:FkbM family methyltransferase
MAAEHLANPGTLIEGRRPACEDWTLSVLRRMYQCLHTFETDNFDSFRFSEERRGSFFVASHAEYLQFFLRNSEPLYKARSLLSDVKSAALFDDLILFRLAGHLHVKLGYNSPATQEQVAVPPEWKIDDTGDAGKFGPLSIFSVPYKGLDIWVKGWVSNVSATFLSGQYHFERDGVRIEPSAGDHAIDGGGCFGDTALAFAHEVGEGGRVYTFDPIQRHCRIMQEALQMNRRLAPRVRIFDTGLSDVSTPRRPNEEKAETINPGARLDGDLPTCTIDELVAGGDIERIDFIKLDVEGSELSTLRGATQSIRKWKPKLAISLYHRPEDFFAIPLWLADLDCGYRFHLDHYSIHTEETVLYGQVA